MKLPTKKTKKSVDFMRMNTLLYGAPKIGKSTFASKVNGGDGVLFLPTEDGYKSLEIYSPFGDKRIMTDWQEIYTLGRMLSKEKHDFRYLVVDIVDWFHKHCEAYIAKKHDVEHVNDLAYGKGASLVKDEFIRMVNGFNSMGFGILFLSHAKEREFKTKSASWTVMDTSLPPSTGNLIAGLCDFIFYAYLDEEGNRKIRTKKHKYVNAGDRTGLLPEVMNLDPSEIQRHLEKGRKK